MDRERHFKVSGGVQRWEDPGAEPEIVEMLSMIWVLPPKKWGFYPKMDGENIMENTLFFNG